MTAADKHTRADQLREQIAEQEQLLTRLKQADKVEVSLQGRGYHHIDVTPYQHTTDVLGEVAKTPLRDRLGKDERRNIATIFLDNLIMEHDMALDELKSEYEKLFAANTTDG